MTSMVCMSSSLYSAYHDRLDQIIKKRKRIENEIQDGPSDFIKQLVKNIKIEELENDTKIFSNDMADCLKTICKICLAKVSLNAIRMHTMQFHNLRIKEYKEKFGNPGDNVITMVYHKCGLCQKELKLNWDDMKGHLSWNHNLKLKDYSATFLVHTSRVRIKKEIKEEGLEDEGLDSIQDIENLFDSL